MKGAGAEAPLDKPLPRRFSRRVQSTRCLVRPASRWLCLLVLGVFSVLAQAAAPATNAVVAGTWTYTLEVSLDTSVDFVAELKQDGERVTGTVTAREVMATVEKGQFKNGQLTFEIPREYGGVKFTSRYQGQLAGDRLKGKIVTGTGPLERTYEWSAQRAKPAAKP